MYQKLPFYFAINQCVNPCPKFPVQKLLHNLEQLGVSEKEGLLSQSELGNTFQIKYFLRKR